MRQLQWQRLWPVQEHWRADLPYLRRFWRYQCLNAFRSIRRAVKHSPCTTNQKQTCGAYQVEGLGSPGKSSYASMRHPESGNPRSRSFNPIVNTRCLFIRILLRAVVFLLFLELRRTTTQSLLGCTLGHRFCDNPHTVQLLA